MDSKPTRDPQTRSDEAQEHLRGGTEGGEPGRAMDPKLKEEGTRSSTSMKGGVHPSRRAGGPSGTESAGKP